MEETEEDTGGRNISVAQIGSNTIKFTDVKKSTINVNIGPIFIQHPATQGSDYWIAFIKAFRKNIFDERLKAESDYSCDDEVPFTKTMTQENGDLSSDEPAQPEPQAEKQPTKNGGGQQIPVPKLPLRKGKCGKKVQAVKRCPRNKVTTFHMSLRKRKHASKTCQIMLTIRDDSGVL